MSGQFHTPAVRINPLELAGSGTKRTFSRESLLENELRTLAQPLQVQTARCLLALRKIYVAFITKQGLHPLGEVASENPVRQGNVVEPLRVNPDARA